jgi:TonB family protein
VAYDDPVVRAAAVSALGRYNGAVVAVDPNSGRILTVVNQKVAFSDGYIPCSTIKPTIAIAALEENVITRDTMLKVGRRKYMNLTDAMAHSNNEFFEELGRRLGFETVVDEHGLPRDLKVVRPLGLGLDQKAIEAVEKWKFSPGKKDGKPVPVQATIEVNFRLL